VIGIIGGSGASDFPGVERLEERTFDTPYGSPSASLLLGRLNGEEVVFLPRHGSPHRIPPHQINYRANIWAMRECGVTGIIALNAVGAISAQLAPADLAIPDQILDYTWGRAHTFFDSDSGVVRHVDFTEPYAPRVRESISNAASALGIRCFTPCCYAATQGPRLESAAEIDRLERDGADVVGMTGMPEAALARELELPYASICIIANMAAGRGEGEITMGAIEENLAAGMKNAFRLVAGSMSIAD
jgi:5'-deoxy-5'-methylthioadenosine phosphorylase